MQVPHGCLHLAATIARACASFKFLCDSARSSYSVALGTVRQRSPAIWRGQEEQNQRQCTLRKPVVGCLDVYVLNAPQHVNEFSSAPNEKFTWCIQYTKEND